MGPIVNSDFMYVALTSLVMKCPEKILVKTEVKRVLDLFQFGYQSGRSTDDAISIAHLVLRYLEESKPHARLSFTDFSSAFNAVKPHIFL